MNVRSLSLPRLGIPNLVADKPKSKHWFPSLDGLRALAVLFVFLEHVTGNVFREDAAGDGAFGSYAFNFGDAGMGSSGVYLFFVLSSFLLTNQLLKPNMNFKSIRLWMNYAFKRLIRIYPLYLFVLLVYLVFPAFQFTGLDFFNHVILKDGLNHFWTISVEVKYYLLLPGIVLLITKGLRRNVLAVFALCVGLAIAKQVLQLTGWQPERLSILPHLSIFLVGSWAALIHTRLVQTSAERGDAFKRWMEALSIVSLLLIVLTLKTALTDSLHTLIFGTDMPEFPRNHWIFLFHGLLWATFLIGHLHGSGWMSRLLSWKPLRYIGVVSFGMYLWHIAVMGYLNARLSTPGLVTILAMFVVTVLLATVTHIAIERPTMRLKLPLGNDPGYSEKKPSA